MVPSLLLSALVAGFAVARKHAAWGGLPGSCGLFFLGVYFVLLRIAMYAWGARCSRWWLWMTAGVLLFFVGLGRAIVALLPFGGGVAQALWELPAPRVMLTWLVGALLAMAGPRGGCLLGARHLVVRGLADTIGGGCLVHIWLVWLAYPAWDVVLGNGLMFCLGGLVAAVLGYGLMARCAVHVQEAPALYQGLALVFCGACLFAHLLVVKLVLLWGRPVTASLFVYGITFLLTDVLSELYGRRNAARVVWAAFYDSVLFLVMIGLAALFPVHPGYPVGDAFGASFGFVSLTVVASMVAFLGSQFADLYLFDRLRERTSGRLLWLRNNVATISSQALDSMLFCLVTWALWALFPAVQGAVLTWSAWKALTCYEYLCKVCLALLDTPVVYGLLYVGRRVSRWSYRVGTS